MKAIIIFSRILSRPPMLNLNNSLPQSDTRIIIAQGGGQGQATRATDNTPILKYGGKSKAKKKLFPFKIELVWIEFFTQYEFPSLGLSVLGKFRWLRCNITQGGSGLISLIFTNPWSFKLLAPCHHHFSSPTLTHDKLFNNNFNGTLSYLLILLEQYY